MSDVSELGINNTVYDINSKSITDQNGGKLRFWTGTRTQYDAIVTKDAETLYTITDDVTDNNSIVADLNNKADVDLTNCTVPVVVSRTPNSQGGITEIWSDGYCVQTGNTWLSSNPQTINLPQSFIDTNYVITTANGDTNTDAAPVGSAIYSKTVNNFIVVSGYQGTFYANNLGWRAEGYIR